MDCSNCNDRFKCEFYMSDYPGSGNLWRAKKLCKELEKKELYEHVHEVSLLLKDLNISNEKYQDLIIKQSKLALYLK